MLRLMSNTLLLSVTTPGQAEVFHSLQGEGPFVGRPSTFIRTSGCNLYCFWCDTPYTWNFSGTPFVHESSQKYERKREQVELHASELAARVRSLGCKNVVLTGGEPLLQQSQLLSLFRELGSDPDPYVFDVETNGTVTPVPSFDDAVFAYVVSPKLKNSRVKDGHRLRDEALHFFADSRKAYFKFVVDSPERDREEVMSLIRAYQLPRERCFLMPAATSPQALETRAPEIARLCADEGLRFSDRLHLRLYGSSRGT